MATSLYDTDFFAWTQDTAEQIRKCRFHDIDLRALAEEIEDLGKRDRKEVISRMGTIILHLLKLEYQPEMQRNSRSWRSSIIRERGVLDLLLEDSPSLKVKAEKALARAYTIAARRAAEETGLSPDKLPQTCPYTYEQVLDTDFFPKPK
jgi:hypothetical protein